MTATHDKEWKVKQKKELAIAKLIQKEMSFTNGWLIEEEGYRVLCRKTAEKIMRYYIK